MSSTIHCSAYKNSHAEQCSATVNGHHYKTYHIISLYSRASVVAENNNNHFIALIQPPTPLKTAGFCWSEVLQPKWQLTHSDYAEDANFFSMISTPYTTHKRQQVTHNSFFSEQREPISTCHERKDNSNENKKWRADIREDITFATISWLCETNPISLFIVVVPCVVYSSQFSPLNCTITSDNKNKDGWCLTANPTWYGNDQPLWWPGRELRWVHACACVEWTIIFE